jgi:peptidoglycan/xylan/chitin deacetylase (PgdA/CDA1 family)
MTLYLILTGLLLLWIIIYPVTDAYVRWMAPSVIRRGKISGKRIHLSFDDGPDPDNTLKFLDILREMKVPATFFLVGEKAVRHPELVQYIIRDGHHIGLHTQYHRHAYLMGPGKSLDSVIKGKRVLEEVSRQPIIFFRPPWGALNLFEYGISKILGLKVVLWTANAQDWEKGTGMEGILERLFRKTTSGTIIVLHDSGGEPGAPQNTLLALPKIITQFQSQGYEFVTLSEIIGGQ